MNFNFKENENFTTFPQSVEIKSNFIPLIAFKTIKQKETVESYIKKEAEDFFVNILNISSYVQISYPKLITKQDFRQIHIKEFYKNLFSDLGERDGDNRLVINLKWGITFDEENTPIQIKSKNEETIYDHRLNRPIITYRPHYQNLLPYRKYGTIDINGTPVFYYLYFTFQEILDVIKTDVS